ncbi:MAG: ATP-binding protein [Gammaproteobacteria bacterium]|nr:ATP-binding protein [Gammaproteobacteria bacterium]
MTAFAQQPNTADNPGFQPASGTMLESDLHRLIAAGEGAKVEFKRDDLRPEQLAREIVSFANMNGGTILVGLEDDGAVSGIKRADWQQWLMDTVVSRHVVPRVVPDYEEVTTERGTVAVVAVPTGSAKPYAVQRRDRLDYYLRIGNTGQRATREQMARLFQIGGLLSVERLPIHGSTMRELDQRRLDEYFLETLGEEEADDWSVRLRCRATPTSSVSCATTG